MPVYSKHKKAEEFTTTWQLCRDVVAGERVVKSKGELYLPKLTAQDPEDYESYKKRATFFGATRRTLQGLLGAIFRKEPEIEPPSPYVRAFIDDVVREAIEVGRLGVLVDVSQTGGSPYMVLYKAEDITNWAYDMVDGEVVLKRIVLREQVVKQADDDEFENEEEERYRVLSMIDGVYHSGAWENIATTGNKTEWIQTEDVIPTMRGVPMDFIPFVFINALNDKPDVDEPPLADIARINLSHYRSSADLEHGRHYTALPTPWVAGFDPTLELVLGSGQAWVTDNTAARAGFLEFTGSGLSTLVQALDEKQMMMAVSGSRMLEGQRAGIEAAETARIHKAGEEATIVSIAKNVSASMTKAYQWLLDFQLTPAGKKALVALSTDYLNIPIDPAKITALLSAFQAGIISMDTLLWNLKQGEIIPDDRTIEDEKELAEADRDKMMAVMEAMNKDKPKTDEEEEQ